VTVVHDKHRIRVGEVDPSAGRMGSLAVEIDGTVVGLIEFGPSPRIEAASAVDRVRRDSHVPFALVSPQGSTEVSSLAKSLGVEMFRGDFTTADTAEFLLACRTKGLKAAFVGDCRLHPLAASRAHVAISVADDAAFDLELDPAAFLIQQPGLAPLVDLSRIARDHASRVHQAQNLILVPNLLCIAGAFFFGFTGMTAVMLSNLGTLGLYRIASDSLRGLDSPNSGRKGQPRRAG
jgi:cation transport ATPase